MAVTSGGGWEYRSPMNRCAVVALLALSGAACDRRHADSAAPLASTAPSTRPAISSSHLHLHPIAAGYGGAGPATPPPYPDVWVVLIVGVDAGAKLTGIAVERLELVDAAGKVVARGTSPFSLRLDGTPDGGKSSGDFSEQGTTPFDGLAEPGRDLRLRIGAPLDPRAERLKPPPARVRALVKASNEVGTWVEAPLQGPWPTG
jgi:hypothetical protein